MTKTLLSLIALGVAAMALATAATSAVAGQEVYGPVNLIKSMPTPFGAARPEGGQEAGAGEPVMQPIAINSLSLRLGRRSLGDRLVTSRLYMPGRLVMGHTAEFTVKGRPGAYVALAMADKDSGAKPIYGHNLRLGSDRKVVALAQLPDSGVATLAIETPIQGDLIGQNWYFEAAVWSRKDFSDMEIAVPVSSEGQEGVHNGVLVSAETEHKRGIKFVPNAAIPLQQMPGRPGSGIDSGRL